MLTYIYFIIKIYIKVVYKEESNIKEKILVVFTGGTIQSEIKDNAICVAEDKKYLLLDMYEQEENKQEVEFDIIFPVCILSEDATAEDWTNIVESIKAQDLSEYKGIIITYGTDTLGYFANALSYLLYKIQIPIMIVASDFVLTDKKANGLENFKTAVDFIVEKGYKGVFIPYKNNNGEMYIHQGIRVKQIGQLSDSVYSVNDNYFMQAVNGNMIKRSDYNNCVLLEKDYDFKICDDILYIRPTIGTKYDFCIDNYRVIFHEMFHSGTIPKQAIDLIKKCKEKNILFFMGVSHDGHKTLYGPTQEAVDTGGIIITNMSQEAAIMKLMVALGTFKTNEEIKEFMNHNIIGEILEY